MYALQFVFKQGMLIDAKNKSCREQQGKKETSFSSPKWPIYQIQELSYIFDSSEFFHLSDLWRVAKFRNPGNYDSWNRLLSSGGKIFLYIFKRIKNVQFHNHYFQTQSSWYLQICFFGALTFEGRTDLVNMSVCPCAALLVKLMQYKGPFRGHLCHQSE